MTDQVPATRKDNPVAILQKAVTIRESEFAKALPPHVPSQKFVRTFLTALTSSKDLGQCTERSVIIEAMKAAADGLVIDNREATMVKMNCNVGSKDNPKWEAQAKYIPMYAGLMKMARNSGEISTIAATMVHEKDLFKYNPGIDDVPLHEIDWFGERGAAIGCYSVVRLKDNSAIVEIMSKAQILKIASGTKNSKQYDPDKGDSFAEWWRKTVIRRISKYLPRSTDKEGGDFFEAVRRDDDMYEVPDAAPPTGDKQPRKKRGQGAAALAAAPEPVDVPEADGEPEMPEFLRRHATDETPEPQPVERDLV